MPELTRDIFGAVDAVPVGAGFPAHHHEVDQLAWAPEGGMRVRVDGAQWRTTGEQAVWVPGGAEHEIFDIAAPVLHSLYLLPARRRPAARWSTPHVLRLEPLARELLLHLSAGPRPLERTEAAVMLLFELLEEQPVTSDALVVPTRPEARAVAEAILADPADASMLSEWAARLGVSEKTLLRAFVTETDLTFAQWRTRARVYRGAQALAAGGAVQDVAADVGYDTATGFIKAFRGVFRTTPAAYAARMRPAAADPERAQRTLTHQMSSIVATNPHT